MALLVRLRFRSTAPTIFRLEPLLLIPVLNASGQLYGAPLAAPDQAIPSRRMVECLVAAAQAQEKLEVARVVTV